MLPHKLRLFTKVKASRMIQLHVELSRIAKFINKKFIDITYWHQNLWIPMNTIYALHIAMGAYRIAGHLKGNIRISCLHYTPQIEREPLHLCMQNVNFRLVEVLLVRVNRSWKIWFTYKTVWSGIHGKKQLTDQVTKFVFFRRDFFRMSLVFHNNL